MDSIKFGIKCTGSIPKWFIFSGSRIKLLYLAMINHLPKLMLKSYTFKNCFMFVMSRFLSKVDITQGPELRFTYF